MRRRTEALSLAAAVVVWTGCGGAGPRTTATVADSAGIEVVTNLAGAVESAAVWTLSANPVLEIGAGASPDVPLFQVSAVQPLDGGRVAVGMESPPRALVFGSGGALATELGRQGGGPGEFERVASVVPMAGDSLAVWDPDRRRISVFTRAGRFAREVDLSELAPIGLMAAPTTATPAAWTYLLRWTGHGFVLFSDGAFGPGTGARRPEAPSYRISRDGERLADLGSFPGYESYSSDQTGVLPYPFGADTHAAVSGEALVVGTAESTELRYYGPGGSLARIVRWPDHDRTVAGPFVEEWDSMFAGWMEQMPPQRRGLFKDMFDRIPRPDAFPAYDGVIPGADGRVWVGEYAGVVDIPATPVSRRVPARRWLVFDGVGVLIATVETPLGFSPRVATADRVWGVYRDELDVESVRAYTITRNPTGGGL